MGWHPFKSIKKAFHSASHAVSHPFKAATSIVSHPFKMASSIGHSVVHPFKGVASTIQKTASKGVHLAKGALHEVKEQVNLVKGVEKGIAGLFSSPGNIMLIAGLGLGAVILLR